MPVEIDSVAIGQTIDFLLPLYASSMEVDYIDWDSGTILPSQ